MLGPTFRVLKNRQFAWFLGSWATASTGYSVFAISIVWLAYQSSHSLFVVGAVLAVERGAYCVTFLVAPIADRVRNQRSIFLVSYPIQAAAAIALGVLAAEHRLPLVTLLALVVLLSLLWDLSWAAANAAPGILLSPDEQFAATGVAGLLGGVNSIAGYAAGGVLILLVGAGGGMYLYAGLLLAGTLLAAPLRVRPPGLREATFGDSFRAGWRTLVGGPGRPLLQLAGVDAAQGFFSAGPILLLALVAVRLFGTSALDYATLFVAYVVGGVFAGLLFAQRNPRGRVGALVGGALLGGGVALLAVAGAPPALSVAAALWFAIGFTQSAYLDAKYAFLRGSVAPGQLGRVVSNLYLFPGVTSTAGALVLGSVAAATSAPGFAFELALGVLAAGALAVALPGVRGLRY